MEQITQGSSQEDQSIFTMSWLIQHTREILFKDPIVNFGKGRISRGEMRMASLLVAVLGGIVSLLEYVLPIVGLIVGIATLLLSISYSIKRSHDLNKSGRYYYIPMILLVVCFGVFFGTALSITISRENLGQTVNLISGIGALIGLVWMIVVGLQMSFAKGTTGDNAYGPDPLTHQPASNGVYRGLGIILVIVAILLSAAGPQQDSLIQEKLNQLRSGNSSTNPSANNSMIKGWTVNDFAAE